MTRCIAIVNEKGGCAKTTTALNLAAGLALKGQRVLVIDYDPQGNAGQALGLMDLIETGGIYDSDKFTFHPEETFLPYRDLPIRGVDVIPCTTALAYSEWEWNERDRDRRLLADAIARVREAYDYVLADCGPSIGATSLRAMLACPELLIPVKLEYLSVPGAQRLHKHLENLASNYPTIPLKVLGILGTFYREAAKTPREVLDVLRTTFGGQLFNTVIHQAQAVADAVTQQKPVIVTEPTSRSAQEYIALTKEVIDRG